MSPSGDTPLTDGHGNGGGAQGAPCKNCLHGINFHNEDGSCQWCDTCKGFEHQ